LTDVTEDRAELLALRCPYDGGRVWTSDEGAWCVAEDSGRGCGAWWDAVGEPQSGPTPIAVDLS
jgi:hypothetical protein